MVSHSLMYLRVNPLSKRAVVNRKASGLFVKMNCSFMPIYLGSSFFMAGSLGSSLLIGSEGFFDDKGKVS